MTGVLVVPPGGGELLDLGTFEAEVLARSSQTDDAFSVIQTQNEPPGFGPPLHIHHDAAEAFFVLDGEYRMFVEEQELDCPVGTFVYVPRGVAHTFQVVSAGPGRKLNLFVPGAMTGFFEELAAAEAAGGADHALVEAAARRHHMEVVGPVPDSYVGGR